MNGNTLSDSSLPPLSVETTLKKESFLFLSKFRRTGNKLLRHVPLFLREPVKIVLHGKIGKSKVALLTAA